MSSGVSVVKETFFRWAHHRVDGGLKVLPQIGAYCMSRAAVVR